MSAPVPVRSDFNAVLLRKPRRAEEQNYPPMGQARDTPLRRQWSKVEVRLSGYPGLYLTEEKCRACLASARNCEILRFWCVISIVDMDSVTARG